MTALRVTATLPMAPVAPVVACVGNDAAGVLHAWFTAGAVQPGAECDVPEEERFPCRPGASAEEMLGLLRHWPAWRISQLAQLELGSGLLVVGGGWLARRVLEFASLWGCLWRASCGPAELRPAAEFWVERADAQALRRMLPANPDAVVLLTDEPDQIAQALSLCRDKGCAVMAFPERTLADLNLYPDVHRRSLRVVGCAPLGRRAVSDDEVYRGFERIAALMAAGAIARP
jgi:hypothetical protein